MEQDNGPDLECRIAAMLAASSFGSTGAGPVALVNRYVEVLAALREAGGPLQPAKIKRASPA